MNTGWKAARQSRRPHSKQKLRRHPPNTRISRKRRTAAKNSNAALRLRGQLP